ncbi:hypothetical protein [Parasegetibacter sp. NRK P23]|uniref:DoxX family protein n=1 Tax=Parasegetibacter sp. NRK P23 TaxID=2942999 RepID=UPI002044077B|nr:hypothetical protein [Parasegetibacter sp. NRK P23]MCM5529293.1 hypothetical protein [Parasegetibacter sp. NRK P23]
MKPLIVLLGTFLVALLVIRLAQGRFDWAQAARIGMSAMLVFTAVGHVMYTKGMEMMVPAFIPAKTTMVYGTGIIEVLAAIGLLVPQFRVLTAWLLIVFFILVLPANVLAAVKQVNYQKGDFSGAGTSYLWFRVPLQVLFIVWTYLCSVKAG